MNEIVKIAAIMEDEDIDAALSGDEPVSDEDEFFDYNVAIDWLNKNAIPIYQHPNIQYVQLFNPETGQQYPEPKNVSEETISQPWFISDNLSKHADFHIYTDLVAGMQGEMGRAILFYVFDDPTPNAGLFNGEILSGSWDLYTIEY